MGTRHLIAVIKNNEVKVAQYGQFDGYISGAGADVISFIKDKLSHVHFSRKFNDNVLKSFFADDEFLRNAQIEAGLDPDTNWVAHGDPAWTRYIDKYPQFSRNTSSEILNDLCESPLVLIDSFEFGKDSLFCEYAYVINLDDEVLEIYTGFNKKPLPEYEIQRWGNEPDNSGYYPVSLCKILSFEEIFNSDDDLIERLNFESYEPEHKSELVMESLLDVLSKYVDIKTVDVYLNPELEQLQNKIYQYFMEK